MKSGAAAESRPDAGSSAGPDPVPDGRTLAIVVASALLFAVYSFGYDRWRLPPQVSELGTFGRTLAGDVLPMLVAPILVVRFVLRAPLASAGLRFRPFGPMLRAALVAWLAVLPLVVVLALRPEIVDFYPSRQFPPAREHVVGLVALWTFMHAPQMASVECLFRGYLLQPLARRFGFEIGAALMLVPYVALHATKPSLELLLATWAGFVFALAAWRTRSFVPAFVAHWLTAVTMDALCFAQLR
jgi:membrane protease YdiL (CAAX protease family)